MNTVNIKYIFTALLQRLVLIARTLVGNPKVNVQWSTETASDVNGNIYIGIGYEIEPGIPCSLPELILANKAKVAHECGHEMFTSLPTWEEAVKEGPVIRTLVNIIEDGRIEALVAEESPGAGRWLKYLNQYIFKHREDYGEGLQAFFGGLINYSVNKAIPPGLPAEIVPIVKLAAPYVDIGRAGEHTQVVLDQARLIAALPEVQELIDDATQPCPQSPDRQGTNSPKKGGHSKDNKKRADKAVIVVQKRAKNDPQNSKDDPQNSKDDSQNSKDGSQNSKDDTQEPKEDSQKNKSSSNNNKNTNKEDPQDSKEDAPGAKGDSPDSKDDPQNSDGDSQDTKGDSQDDKKDPQDSEDDSQDYKDSSLNNKEKSQEDPKEDPEKNSGNDPQEDSNESQNNNNPPNSENDSKEDSEEDSEEDSGNDSDDFQGDSEDDSISNDESQSVSNDSQDDDDIADDMDEDMPCGNNSDQDEHTDEDSLDEDSLDDLEKELLEEGYEEENFSELESLAEEELTALQKEAEKIEEKEKPFDYTKGISGVYELKTYTPNRSSYYHTIKKDLRVPINNLAKSIKIVIEKRKGREVRNLQKGNLSQRSLYKTGMKDSNIFQKNKRPGDIPDTVFYVLTDNSGSMCGHRIENAIKATCILSETARILKIPHAVTGFTSHSGIHQVVHRHFVTFEESLNGDSSRIGSMCDEATNRDGYSIRVATNQLMTRQEDKKVLFVLSDGLPSCYSSEENAVEDTRLAALEAEKKGIKVISLYFGEVQRDWKVHSEMYRNSINVEDVEDLPGILGRAFKKVYLS